MFIVRLSQEKVRSMSDPRSDGNRVTFDVRDGKTQVHCAISRSALLDIADRPYMRSAELVEQFLKSRSRIEAIALAKYHRRSGQMTGLVHVWSNDVDPPPESAPAMACAMTYSQTA